MGSIYSLRITNDRKDLGSFCIYRPYAFGDEPYLPEWYDPPDKEFYQCNSQCML